MTAKEAFDHVTGGGSGDFNLVIEACRFQGAYCLIGGLAVNCYVEPVYTLDADIVIQSARLSGVGEALAEKGFVVEDFKHSLNATLPGSQLRIQFTKDSLYQPFPERAVDREIFGILVKVAALEDVFQGKLWAWQDHQRRPSKRMKDQADLIRICESYPTLTSLLPDELRRILEPGYKTATGKSKGFGH